MRRESHVAHSALSRLTDAREGLREQAVDVLASDAREGLKESRRDSRVAYSALARLADAREGLKGSELPTNCSQLARLADAHERLKKAAANRALPTPRWRVSRMHARC